MPERSTRLQAGCHTELAVAMGTESASCCTCDCRLGSKSQAPKKKAVKSNLRKEFDRMATSGGWDNDDEDDEQGYSAEEMDIDQVAGGSAAASGAPHPSLVPKVYALSLQQMHG